MTGCPPLSDLPTDALRARKEIVKGLDFGDVTDM